MCSMKINNLHTILALVFVVLVTSCKVQKDITIEVLKPAKDPLQNDYTTIVLIDNTKQQPANKGNYYTLKKFNDNGKLRSNVRKQIKDSIKVDSLGFSCVFNAANQLLASDYLDTVVVWPRNMSDTKRGWNSQMLSPSEVKHIADSTGADLVASLDMLSYLNEVQENQYPENIFIQFYDDGIVNNAAQTEYFTIWRFYDGTTMNLVDTKTYRDTIFFGIDYLENDVEMLKDLLKTMISEAAWRAGTTVSEFFPGWFRVNRVYFRSGTPGIRIGSRFFENGQSDDAFKEWEKVYNTARGKNKARAAFDLAFYYEMNDDLNKAMEYLENARLIYLDSKILSESSPDYELIRSYIKVIEKRLKEDKMLKMQINL